MGIKKGFKKFLKEKSPDSFKTIKLEELCGRKIAFDAVNVFYSHWCVCQNKVFDQMGFSILREDINVDSIQERWLDLVWKTVSRILSYGITPVMVFDGLSPKEKKETQEDRISKSNKAKERAEELKAKIREVPEHLKTKDMLAPLKTCYAQWHTISKSNFVILKIMFKGMGLPVLDAVGEGEALCSELCRKGYVYAAYSTDTDNLAHLCPRWIYELDQKTAEIVYLDRLLSDLGFGGEQFRDFCILLGCDYNDGVSGVAAPTAYRYLDRFGSLEKIDSIGKEELISLNHVKCRELFNVNILIEAPNLLLDKLSISTYLNDSLTPLKMDHISEKLGNIYKAVDFDKINEIVADDETEEELPMDEQSSQKEVKKVVINLSGLTLWNTRGTVENIQ